MSATPVMTPLTDLCPDKHNDIVGYARHVIAKGTVETAGYRIQVYPIQSSKAMEDAEVELFPTLNEGGFEVKTDKQQDRESRGTFHGVVISIGQEAYNDRIAKKGPWCKEGDVVIFHRYAGHRIEHPPGSKTEYQFMNDEDILGVIKL